jgi:hypothetical protein
MHRDMVGLVALDLVLRFFIARVMGITFPKNVFGMHLGDFSTDMASLRVPRYVVSNLESLRHIAPPRFVPVIQVDIMTEAVAITGTFPHAFML